MRLKDDWIPFTAPDLKFLVNRYFQRKSNTAIHSLEKLIIEERKKVFFGQSLLLGRISVPKRYGSILFDGFKIDGNAPRCTDFVHTAITSSNGPRSVPESCMLTLDFPVNL